MLHGRNDDVLETYLARYLAEGLASGAAALVVTSATRRQTLCRKLALDGIDIEACARSERLVFLDARTTLEAICVDGKPDAARFRAVVGARIERIARRFDVLAYGEMVGLLWEQRDERGAIALEALWGELQRSCTFELLCAYPIDVFGPDFDERRIDPILCQHNELVSAHPKLRRRLDRAMDDVLGHRAAHARFLMKSEVPRGDWGEVSEGEATLLWLRKNLPRHAEEIVDSLRVR